MNVRAAQVDPKLKPLIEQMAAIFDRPAHLWPPAELRAFLAKLNDAAVPPRPADISAEDRLVDYASRRVPVRIYRSARTPSPAPALIYMHGGGWMAGSLNSHDAVCAGIASLTGCVVISVDYALAPEHPYPAALLDCLTVSDWLSRAAATLDIRSDRIAIGGDSAGATLAAGLSLKYRDERGAVPFCFQLLIYPALDTDFSRPSYVANRDALVLDRDMMVYFWSHYLGAAFDGSDAYAKPLRMQDLSGLPPAYIATAGFDPLRDDGALYAAGLIAAGVNVEYRNAPELVHGFIRFRHLSEFAEREFTAMCDALFKALRAPK